MKLFWVFFADNTKFTALQLQFDLIFRPLLINQIL